MHGTEHMKPRATFSAMLTALRRLAIATLGRAGQPSGADSPMKLTAADLSNLMPEGWKLVPLEMTPEMHKACQEVIYRHLASQGEYRTKKERKNSPAIIPAKIKQQLRWRAMLDAAPEYKQAHTRG